MAQEYIANRQKHDLGMIALSKSVFASIAKIATDEEDALMLHDQMNPFKNSITCKIQDDQMILTVDVKVKYDANVQEVCSNLQTKIYENISHMTDYEPDVIDIRVTGFMF